MWVKICGITTMRAAVAAAEAGADAVGLNFAGVAPAYRRVTPDRAQSLITGLPATLARVGIFVNETVAEMARIADCAGLTHLQLHGDEPPAYLPALPMPVIKAFRLQSAADLPGLMAYREAWGMLLEPHVTGLPGGAGVALDWCLAGQAREFLHRAGYAGKVILAGGLKPDSVRAAITAVTPDGVDVSSGVETDGVKDINKIYAFVQNARRSQP